MSREACKRGASPLAGSAGGEEPSYISGRVCRMGLGGRGEGISHVALGWLCWYLEGSELVGEGRVG